MRNPQSFNRYVYAGNSPLAKVDPSGLVTMDCGPVADTCVPDSGFDFDTDGGGFGMFTGGGDGNDPSLGSGYPTIMFIPGVGLMQLHGWPDEGYSWYECAAFCVTGDNATPSSAGGQDAGMGAPNGGNYGLLTNNTTLSGCEADAKAASAASYSSIIPNIGDWIGTTVAGAAVKAIAGRAVTIPAVAEGAAIGLAGRALYFSLKGLTQQVGTFTSCAISAGTTSLYNTFTGVD
jgi:hypothetical protein